MFQKDLNQNASGEPLTEQKMDKTDVDIFHDSNYSIPYAATFMSLFCWII